MDIIETKRICKEWLNQWEEYFSKEGISDDKKFWYPISICINGLETEKAQQIIVNCYDNNCTEEMNKGEYFTHSLGGKETSIVMWMPKKVIDFDAKKAPYGIIRKNILEK